MFLSETDKDTHGCVDMPRVDSGDYVAFMAGVGPLLQIGHVLYGTN